MEQQQFPPIMLVKTWIDLLSTDEEEARRHGKCMLIGAFGSVELGLMYFEQTLEKLRA